MLLDPPPGDWLMFRRTYDGQGHSPLDQITTDNVGDLQLAWVWSMADGSNQPTPLVHDGIMYLTNPGNIIQALDARTGDVIWQYAREFPEGFGRGGSRLRNISIYQDKLFIATADAALVALDARSGEIVWEHQIADPEQGYTSSSGPMVMGGVVVNGINGCSRFQEDSCFITGHDPDTGEELWRTLTIAQPGEPGGDSWGEPAARLARRRRFVDGRQLRPRARSDLLADGAGQAVGARQPGPHGARRRALYQRHAGAAAEHRRDRVVLPARTG